MQCRQCGAKNQPGATQCTMCGAALPVEDGAGQERPRPPQQDRYIPGGASAHSAPPQPPTKQQRSSPSAPRRPQGSLGRRLAQQSVPPGGDDAYPPPPRRESGGPRRGMDENYPPRGGRDGNYPPRGGARPGSRPDGRARGRNYDGYDEEPAMDDGGRYDGAGRGAGRGYDGMPNWGEDRGRPASARRDRDRGGPPLPPLSDESEESEEMIARREPPRAGSRRRAPEPAMPEWSDEYPNPYDDSREQPGSGRRPPGRYDNDPRRYDSPTGYTEEERAARFDESAAGGYSEEYEARSRYPEERRGPTPGPRGGSRSAPGGQRDGYRDERGGYDESDGDNYRRPGPRPGPGGREQGGFDARYPDVPSYEDIAHGYPGAPRGGQMGYGPQGGFGESSEWQPGGGFGGQVAGAQGRAGRPSSARRTTGKPRNKILPVAFSLFVIVVVVVGLVAVVGPEVAPKLGKYLPFLGGAQATPPPTFATYTPGPTPTLPPSSKLFSDTAAGFAVAYPSAWGTKTESGANNDTSYEFVAPGSAKIALVEHAPAFDAATNDQLVQAEVTSTQGQGITMTEITSAATTEGVGGEVWTRREFQATKGSVKLHIAVLACHHLGKGYVIALISADTSFAADDTATYEPMLRSFRFL